MTELEIANLALNLIGGVKLTALDTTTKQGTVLSAWFDTSRDECLRGHPWNFATKRARLSSTWTAFSGVAFADNGSGLIRATKTSHGLVTDNRVHIRETEGVAGLNASWYVTRIDANNFDLQESTFSGSHTSGTGEFILAPDFGWDYQHSLPSDCLRVLTINGNDTTEKDGSRWQVEGTKLLTDEEIIELVYIFRQETTANWPADFVNAFALLLASYVATELCGTGSGKGQALRQQYETLLLSKAKTNDSREGKSRRRGWSDDSPLVRARRGYRQD
jgi:hypothetical protein